MIHDSVRSILIIELSRTCDLHFKIEVLFQSARAGAGAGSSCNDQLPVNLNSNLYNIGHLKIIFELYKNIFDGPKFGQKQLDLNS